MNGKKLPKAEERTTGKKQTESSPEITDGQEESAFLNNKEKKSLEC